MMVGLGAYSYDYLGYALIMMLIILLVLALCML
jgi:hypothetical protein